MRHMRTQILGGAAEQCRIGTVIGLAQQREVLASQRLLCLPAWAARCSARALASMAFASRGAICPKA